MSSDLQTWDSRNFTKNYEAKFTGKYSPWIAIVHPDDDTPKIKDSLRRPIYHLWSMYEHPKCWNLGYYFQSCYSMPVHKQIRKGSSYMLSYQQKTILFTWLCPSLSLFTILISCIDWVWLLQVFDHPQCSCTILGGSGHIVHGKH